MAMLLNLTDQERNKLRALEHEGHTSAIGVLRDHINSEYAKLKERQAMGDQIATEHLSTDELEMAANLGLRPSEYLLGKRPNSR